MDIKLIIKETLGNAPEPIKLVVKKIISQPTLIDSISSRNNFDEKRRSALETEILLTAIGIDPISQFRSNLIQELKVTYDQAIKITADVNSQIFGQEVVDLLKKAEQGTKDTAPNQTQPTQKQAEKKPERLIEDHPAMVRTDGPHVHTINTPTRTPTLPAQSPQSPAQTPFKSIVDQKLGGNSSTNLENLMSKRAEKYKGGDPYREPAE